MTIRLLDVLALLACAGVYATPLAAQGDADRIQMSVVLAENGSDRLPPASAAIIRQRLEAALAREGAGRAFGDVPTRFAGRATVLMLERNVAPTAPPMVVLSSEVSVVFGDVVSGATVAEFRKAVQGVGQTDEAAHRDVARQVQFDGDDWRIAVKSARAGIVSYFERSCDGILRDGQTLIARAEFERALFILSTVPQEASQCHGRAADAMVSAHTAFLRGQCEVGLGQANAAWAADKSRNGALRVADILGGISPSSPCSRTAEALLRSVTGRLAQYDAAAAREREARAEAARKRYEDDLSLRKQALLADEKRSDQAYIERRLAIAAARDVGIAWARAAENQKPDVYRQTFIVK